MQTVSVIMPIHNEADYLPVSLHSLQQVSFNEYIFILDRCTDSSERLVRQHFPGAHIIVKTACKWKNPLAENFQLGLEASHGNVICTHDADATTPLNLLELLPLLKNNVASVAPRLITCKNGSVWNWLYHYWEKTERFAPLGEQPFGAVRLIRRDCLLKVGGFKDVIAQESLLDVELERLGYKSIIADNMAYIHLRKFSFDKAVHSQIRAGKMRCQLNQPFWRVLGHSALRLRPFVFYGYISEKDKKEKGVDCFQTARMRVPRFAEL